jgi:hypothetical protein
MSNHVTETYKIPDAVKEAVVAISRVLKLTALALVGIGVALGVLFGPDNLFTYAIVAFILVVVTFSLASSKYNSRIKENWAKHSYLWYKNSFPDKVKVDGKIVCRHCGDSRINVKNMMNRSFMRCHSCVQCGATLYYSPEQ